MSRPTPAEPESVAFREAKASLSALHQRPHVDRLAEHVARVLALWLESTGREAPEDLMDRVRAARAPAAPPPPPPSGPSAGKAREDAPR